MNVMTQMHTPHLEIKIEKVNEGRMIKIIREGGGEKRSGGNEKRKEKHKGIDEEEKKMKK